MKFILRLLFFGGDGVSSKPINRILSRFTCLPPFLNFVNKYNGYVRNDQILWLTYS